MEGAFLCGVLDTPICVHTPEGLNGPRGHCVKLVKSIHRFINSSAIWWQTFTKHLKKPLQTIIYMIEIEERAKRKNKSAMGECVEYMLQENMLQVLCGLAKGDRPKGLLILVLKFVMYTMRNVRSTEILNYGQNHTSLHTLLTYIYISLQNDMLKLNKVEKVNLVDFLYHLTFRITYHCPELADLILAD